MRAEADGKALVLLDELGTGTDPTDGAALGVALLRRMVEGGWKVGVALFPRMVEGGWKVGVAFLPGWWKVVGTSVQKDGACVGDEHGLH